MQGTILKKYFIYILLIWLVLFGIFLRFYKIGDIPPGLNLDEASQGYNAYSLIMTGKDRYGMEFPILFRSLGSYQPPLYTYLTIIPVKLFGLSISSVRLASFFAGIVVIFVTVLFAYQFKSNRKLVDALLAGVTVSLAPWAIFFSRSAVEAHLGVALFITGTFFSLLSLSYPRLFTVAAIFFSLDMYAYYAERLSIIIFLAAFITIFHQKIFQVKKWFLIGLIVLLISQLPNIRLFNTEAGFRRVAQVNYFTNDFFVHNGGVLANLPFGKSLFLAKEFTSRYITYLSPRNLFFDSDPQGVRSSPDLSVFYSWMIIPLFVGFHRLLNNLSSDAVKTLLLVLLISPVPAALTKDPFYTTRTLPLLWALSLVISIGIHETLRKVPSLFRYPLILVILSVSLISVYLSNFIFLKYERDNHYGYPYVQLAKIAEERKKDKIVLDSTRQTESYIWIAFFKGYNPYMFQKQVDPNTLRRYYDDADFKEFYTVDNIEIRPIYWEEDIYRNQILVGDNLAISDKQVEEHKLKLEFEITNMRGKVGLKGYSTNPEEKIRYGRSITLDK